LPNTESADILVYQVITARPSQATDRAFLTVLAVLHAGAAVIVAAALWRGRSFYLTPLAQRLFHPGYEMWRPAGSFGHGIGVIGTIMMLVMLLYSVRKRTRLFGRAGRMSRWLGAHIYLGIWGPVLVTLHCAFKVQGLVAVSYWSMVAVAASGVLGRYLYRQIPRSIAGSELSPAELAQRQGEMDRRLAELAPAADGLTDGLDGLSTAPGGGMAGGLWWLLRRNLTLRRDLGVLFARFDIRGDRAELERVARERILLARRRDLGFQVQQAFHYWHVVHKPFAFLMLAIMVVHVGVSVWLGYRWIF
jgi:hypothetical protein